ncbi:hypothetical protein ACN47E_009510 [Coniothyrium glycines]
MRTSSQPAQSLHLAPLPSVSVSSLAERSQIAAFQSVSLFEARTLDKQQARYTAVPSYHGNFTGKALGNTLFKSPVQKQRCHSHALSHEDKLSLTFNEKNRNFKHSEVKDVEWHCDSRQSIEPCFTLKDSSETTDRQTLPPRDTLRLINIREKARAVLKFGRVDSAAAQSKVLDLSFATHKTSRSVHDLRSTGASAPQIPHTSLGSPFFSEFDVTNRASAHARAAGESEHVHHHSRPLVPAYMSTQQSPELFSSLSSRVHNTLAVDVHPLDRTTDITFDSFLVPHKLGKGEAYRDSENASKTFRKSLKKP